MWMLMGMPASVAATATVGSLTFMLIDVPGAFFTQASSINNAGNIVGDFFDGTGERGLLPVRDILTLIDVLGAL